MIEICYHRDPGVRLFQYAFGRAMAEASGHALRSVSPLPFLPETRNPVPGEEILSPVRFWDGDVPCDAASSCVMGMDAFASPPECRLVLRGGFRRIEYVAPFRTQLRERWFRQDDVRRRAKGDLLLCFDRSGGMLAERRGRGHGKYERYDLLEHLLDIVSFERLYVLDPFWGESVLPRKLARLKPTVLCGHPSEQLKMIREFRTIAISQDALQWWGAYLADADAVFYPFTEHGPWGNDRPEAEGIDPIGAVGAHSLRPDDPAWSFDWFES